MEVLVALVAGFIAALILWWKSFIGKPPGPWGLPIVGYIPFLTQKPHLKLTELGKRYGGVFSIRVGSYYTVIVNDFHATKDAFSKDVFIGRPPTTIFNLNKETLESGAFFGLPWKENRRHALHMLRDLGLGKTRMEEHIQEEISDLFELFEKNVGKPFYLRDLISPSMSNNIASLVFGKRFKYDDPVRHMLSRSVDDLSATGQEEALLMFFPWLRNILQFLRLKDTERVKNLSLDLRNYINKEIEEHEKTLDPDNIRDFIDSYLVEIRKRKNDPSFSKPVLQDLVGAFFGAGSETVRQTVEWLVLVAASYPKAQARIQSEIMDVIGPERRPVGSDQKSMPYTEAFISELMRWRTLIPLNLLRYTLADTKLNGYIIPKHTQVLSNLWAVHHNPEYWGPDAEDFRPERFLTDDEKAVKKSEYFIPFSIGKRSCPGEPLAKVEVFLYFIAILQKFNVRMADGKMADFEGTLGLGLQAKPQKVIFSKRE